MSDRLHHVSEFLDFFTSDPNYWEVSDRPLNPQDYRWPQADNDVIGRLKQIEALIPHLDQRLPPAKALPENLKVDYAQDLNAQQLAAATCTDGPLLVIAGAGTGKTRTLIYRLSYLLEQGVDPQRILLMTFTRRAAQQMLERAQMLRPESGAERVMGGTFHSFCAYILRRLAPLVKLQPNFSIIDTVDASDIIDLIVQELKLRGKDRAFPRKGKIQDIISKARNAQVSMAQILEKHYPDMLEKYGEELELIFETFTKYKRGNQLLDYDDLIEITRDELLNNAPFAHKARSLFDYIMVDEYQDTNGIQKELADALAKDHRNLMVVGDDAQSIYGFRGANYENILRFPADWPECHIVRIEHNYRSTQCILDLTNAILSHNQLAFPKHLFTQGAQGERPWFRECLTAEDEAEWIADRILALAPQTPFHEMAVLYRSGYHGNYIQAELIKRQIPFVVYGGIRFTERRHIKDLVAYLRIVMNPQDALAWHRLLQLLPGIGKVTARKIIMQIRQNQGELMPDAFEKKGFVQALRELKVALADAADASTPVLQIQRLRQHYQPLLKSVESDWLDRMPDLDLLENLAQKYDQLPKFLTDFALDPPSNQYQDQTRPSLSESDEKPLVLSTVHSAKGLEWKVVFVVHLLDGLFPSVRSLKDFENLEEERRLFYVACSRAAKYLYLSHPAHYQSYADFFSQQSRFISEIPQVLYHQIESD